MATWQDGAEYAPTVTPVGFATPRAAPLDQAPPVASESEAPTVPPADYTAPAPGPDLASVVQIAVDARDPQLPFDVGPAQIGPSAAWDPRTPLGDYQPEAHQGSTSAWGSVQARRPVEPVHFPPPIGPAVVSARPIEHPTAAMPGPSPLVTHAPPVGVPPVGVPPVGQSPDPYQQRWEALRQLPPPAPAQQAPFPVQSLADQRQPSPHLNAPDPNVPGRPALTAAQAAAAVPWSVTKVGRLLSLIGLPMLGCLLVGAIFQPYSVLLLLCAMMLRRQVAVATGWVNRVFLAAGVVVGITGLASLVAGVTDLFRFLPYDVTSQVAQLACLVLLVLCPALAAYELQRMRPAPSPLVDQHPNP